MGRSLWYVGGVVHLLDLVFFPGCVIPTDNSKFDPNRLFPWMTWERFAKGRTLVGVDEDDEDFATAGLELGEKTHKNTIDEMPSHRHSTHGTYSGGSYKTGQAILRSATLSENADGGHFTDYEGSGLPHNNIQPSTTVYYWRRVS